MGETILPRRMFLWSMAVIYLAAFVSLYLQIPGETVGETVGETHSSAACVEASSLHSLLPVCVSLLAGNSALCGEVCVGCRQKGLPAPG